MNEETPQHALEPSRGWYCPKCDKILFHPDDDIEHEAWHIRVHVWTELAEHQEPTRKLVEVNDEELSDEDIMEKAREQGIADREAEMEGYGDR